MADTRQAEFSALGSDSIFDEKMSGLHRDTDAESVERQNAMLGNLRSNRRVR
jgi:hypothetical protein